MTGIEVESTMKPQALQDAIKAAASKKRNNVDSGGWKEPEVKGHKMTADEFQSLRTKRPQAPPAISSPSYPSSLHSNMGSPGGSGGVAEIVRKMEMELQEFQREKKALIDEMRSHRQRMSDSTDSVESLRREVDKLSSMVERLEGENKKLRDKVRYSSLNGSQSNLSLNPDNADLEKMERRVEQLEKENRLFRDKMKGAGINEIETLRSKIEKLEEERTREPGKTVIPTSRSKGLTPTSPDVPRTTVAPPRSPVASKAACIAPRSPASPSKPKTKPKAPTTPTSSPRLVTASDSTSSSNGAPYLKPHTAEKISKYQGKDFTGILLSSTNTRFC